MLIRLHSQFVDLCSSTTQKILRKDLGLCTYKVQFMHPSFARHFRSLVHFKLVENKHFY